MSRALRAALAKLRTSDGMLPSSQLTKLQRTAIEEFIRCTASVQIKPSGRGVVYVTVQSGVVEQHWRKLSPDVESALNTDLPQRARNIGLSGSSKSAAHQHDIHYLLIKAIGEGVRWRNTNGQFLNVSEQTQQQGASIITIGEHSAVNDNWMAPGDLWLVENQALFDRLDWLPAGNEQSIIYYGGQLRNTLIHWLSSQPRARRLWFFPDYDGVGLHNYLRLKQRLTNGVQFWLMPNWRDKLALFGNNELWCDTQRDFNAATQYLHKVQPEEGVLDLINAMKNQGVALEQEAVWL